jgi:hypothetical protein
MHLTLKTEATRPAAHNVLQQQMRFDTFLHRYNSERPHDSLGRVPPLTFLPRPSSTGESLFALST